MKADNESRKSKPKAAAVKAAADKQAAAKPNRTKPETGEFKFSVGGVVFKVSDTATEKELLKALVVGTVKVSEQIEAVRRTLWRIGEIREYENKGAKQTAKGKPKAGADKGGEK